MIQEGGQSFMYHDSLTIVDRRIGFLPDADDD
jgi:hypothetical protein